MNISDWKSKGTTNMECHKVPSAALFDKTGILKTFGFEAEEIYQDLKRKNIHQEWFFFQSFMYQIRLNKDTLKQTIQTELTESEGKTMLACDVLAAVLRYLKGMMLENIRKRNINIKEGDVYWVLTVVGERCSDEKLLMEQSAIQAELSKIHVVDESAATMAYLTSQFDDYEADSNKRQLQSPSGITHIVIDIGGKISNIYAIRITKLLPFSVNYDLKEVLKEGGDDVNLAFQKMLESLFGTDVINRFQLTEESLDFFREFEIKKRRVDIEPSFIKLKYPALLREYLHEKRGMTLHSCIEQQSLTDIIALVTDKIIISASLVEEFFDGPINKIVTSVEKMLNQSGHVDKRIILVGGFAESRYVREKLSKKLKDVCPGIYLVTPGDESLHVIKGAIILGLNKMYEAAK